MENIKRWMQEHKKICIIMIGVMIVAILGILIGAVTHKNKSHKDRASAGNLSNERVTEEIITTRDTEPAETTMIEESQTEQTIEETTEETTQEITEAPTSETEVASEVPTEETAEDTTVNNYQPSVNAGTGIVYQGSNGRTVTIDAGHQVRGNSEQEPVGPGASKTKAKVTGGASGVVSGLTEYQLNLNVSLRLRDELIARGYTVIMVRETNEVDLSNAQRASIANDSHSDVFLRIHADSYDNSSAKGMSGLCPTPSNPYCSQIYGASRRLADCVIGNMQASTGGKSRGITETDTMSGINWSQVPVVIVEMGFMSNPEEDALMATDNYQQKLAVGMANGIDQYFQ